MVESSNHDQRDLTIVPDENPHAGDEPAFLTDSDGASSTDSLTSSVLSYQYENGRRYHGYREGEYAFPNDEKEQERLDLHHHICHLILGGELFRSPVDLNKPKARILDLGTGTGIWAVEMADEYPKANVTGTDLSPIQPKWTPPNCYFEINDFESEWHFKRPLDFIHGRNIVGSVRDYPLLFKRAHENLNNGGWAEFIDFLTVPFSDDGTLEKCPNFSEWCRLLNEASAKLGKPLGVAANLKQWMIDAGFKNVQEEIYKVPFNPWAKDRRMKEIGRYHQLDILESLEAFSMALFSRSLGWTNQQIHAFLTEVRKELTDRSIHIYAKHYWVYGQKDESG